MKKTETKGETGMHTKKRCIGSLGKDFECCHDLLVFVLIYQTFSSFFPSLEVLFPS